MTRPALIIGALGQDGGLLAARLSATGLPVIGIARRAAADAASPCELCAIDVTDPDALAALIAARQPSRIFYLAAVHHSTEHRPDDRQALWPAMTQVNCAGLVNTIRAVLRHVPDCRLIFAGSSQMYKASETDMRVDETVPAQPSTFYGHTKVWARDAIAFARRDGLKGATAILFNHESTRRAPSFVTRKVTRAAATIARGLQDRLTLADLGGRADWSAAEDVVGALILMGEMAVPQDYVIGSGVLRSVEQLVACAFGRVGLDWRRHVTAERSGTTPAVFADPRRIRTELGWRPQIGFEAMIHAMVDADLAALGAARHS
jgi:GDPmannose 4,6-dehydratase